MYKYKELTCAFSKNPNFIQKPYFERMLTEPCRLEKHNCEVIVFLWLLQHHLFSLFLQYGDFNANKRN